MRLKYFDSIRAFFVSLGFLYHASLIYSPIQYTVNSSTPRQGFAVLAMALHSFRMHGFFLISGYFSMMMVRKYGVRLFLEKRLVRLGIPLFVIGLTIHAWLQSHYKVFDGSLVGIADSRFWLNGLFLRGLWFLSTLILFCCVLSIVIHLCPGVLRWLENQRWSFMRLLSSLVFFSLFSVGFAKSVSLALGSKLFVFRTLPFGRYLPFFALGVVFFLTQQSFEKYTESPLRSILVLLAAIAFSFGVEALPFAKYWRLFLQFPTAFSINAIIFHFAKRYFDRDCKILGNVADASYSMYLFHGPIIIVFATFLLKTSIPVVFQFLIVVVTAWGFAYAIHRAIVMRFPIVSLLVNGQASRR